MNRPFFGLVCRGDSPGSTIRVETHQYVEEWRTQPQHSPFTLLSSNAIAANLQASSLTLFVLELAHVAMLQLHLSL